MAVGKGLQFVRRIRSATSKDRDPSLSTGAQRTETTGERNNNNKQEKAKKGLSQKVLSPQDVPPTGILQTAKSTKMKCVDLASPQITKWLSLNLTDLIETVMDRRFRGTMKISNCKKRCKKGNKESCDIVHEVLQKDFVRQFPCVWNVQKAAELVLYSCFQRFLLEQDSPDPPTDARIYIKCDKDIHKLTFPYGLEVEKNSQLYRPSESDDDQEHPSRPVEDPELKELIKVETSLHKVLQYWRIIHQAAVYDQKKGLFIKDLKRAGLKWKGKTTIRREKVAIFAGAAASASPYLEGTASEVKGYYGGLSDGQPHFRMQLKEMVEHLIPLASQSRAVSSVVYVMDEGSESSGTESCAPGLVVQNDRCESFWNSLYLFHITGRTGNEKGVAIDTVTGVVHNADVCYRNQRFECVLTPATEGRWKEFVGFSGIQWDSFRRLTRNMWLTVKS